MPEKVSESTRSARKYCFMGSASTCHQLTRLQILLYSGPLQTPLLMDFLNTPEKLNRRLTHLPLGRFGEAIEQAKAVLFRMYTSYFIPWSTRSY